MADAHVWAPNRVLKTYLPEGALHHVRVHFNRRPLSQYEEVTKHTPRRPWRLGDPLPYAQKIELSPTFGAGYYSVGYYDAADKLIVVIGPRYLMENCSMLAEWDGGIYSVIDQKGDDNGTR